MFWHIIVYLWCLLISRNLMPQYTIERWYCISSNKFHLKLIWLWLRISLPSNIWLPTFWCKALDSQSFNWNSILVLKLYSEFFPKKCSMAKVLCNNRNAIVTSKLFEYQYYITWTSQNWHERTVIPEGAYSIIGSSELHMSYDWNVVKMTLRVTIRPRYLKTFHFPMG